MPVKQSKKNAGNTWDRDHLEDLGIDERIILKWIFRKQDARAWTGSMAQDRDGWRRLVNAPSGAIKRGEFLD